jgi:hypothetical protein
LQPGPPKELLRFIAQITSNMKVLIIKLGVTGDVIGTLALSYALNVGKTFKMGEKLV